MVLTSQDQNEIINVSKWALKFCYNTITNDMIFEFDDIMIKLTTENPKLVPFHTTNRENYLSIITNVTTLEDFFTHFFLFTGIMHLVENIDNDVVIDEVSRILQFAYQKIQKLKIKGN